MYQKTPAPDRIVMDVIVSWTLILAMIASAIFITAATGIFNGLPFAFVFAACIFSFRLYIIRAGYDLGIITQYKRLGRWIVRQYARLTGCNR